MMDQEPSWRFEGETLVVRVPMRLARRGGRKTVMAPNGANNWAPPSQEPDSALLRALGRAHRWKRLLDQGVYASIGEAARAEKVDYSYLSRVLLLTLVAPDIVEATLDGTSPLGTTQVMRPLPVQWTHQRQILRPAIKPAASDRTV